MSGGWQIEGLPATVQRAGPQAAERTVECVTAQIRNPQTRAAYATAVTRFFTWCDARGLALAQLSPIAVATYIDEMQRGYRAPTIKQHLAAIRRLFDWLVTGQVMPTNPATSVHGPTHVVKTGKTPVLQPTEARLLLDSIDTATLPGLRDRALLAVMVYSFARVSAVVGMRVEDYYQQGKRWWLRLQEKGGTHHAVPVHHKAETSLDAYLDGAGIAAEKDAPLWRSMPRAGGLSARRMSRVDVFRMIKRRVTAVGLGEANCHTFRATGITAYLLNGGHPKEISMPYKTITLTPAQAQRLINTYCYVTEPEPDAVERLTRGELSLYHTPRGDLVEFECDVYGEPVSWLSLDEIDALVYGGLIPPADQPARNCLGSQWSGELRRRRYAHFQIRVGRVFRFFQSEDEQATGLYVLAGLYYLISTTCTWWCLCGSLLGPMVVFMR